MLVAYIILFTILYSMIYYLLDAYHDYHYLEYGNTTGETKKIHGKKWHTTDTIIKAFNSIIVLGGLVYFIYSGYSSGIVYNWNKMLFIAGSLLLISWSIRWIWFDSWLN